MKEEQDKYMDGKLHMLRFTPHIKVFHLNKLIVGTVLWKWFATDFFCF